MTAPTPMRAEPAPAQAGSAPVIQTEALTMRYTRDVTALDSLSVTFEPGITGLVGANGAGKSTLIRILAGLLQPDAGEILLDGKPFVAASAHHAAEAGLSFIHQELALVPDMSVIENIMLGLPKRTRFGWLDWTKTAREAIPVARRVGVTAPLEA